MHPRDKERRFRVHCWKSPKLWVCATVLTLSAYSFCQISDPVHVIPSNGAAVEVHTASPALSTAGAPLKVDVDLVLVPVRVMDSMNRPVTGLKQQDFSLFEDKRHQDVRYFSTEDAPMSIGFLLDLSGTMAEKVDAERDALEQFFKNSNSDDDYFVITFAGTPTVLADATQSTAEIQAKLALAKGDGFTSLLDAVYLGLQKLNSARYERKALVIISDGIDNASRYTLNKVKGAVEESDVTVDAIGLFDDHFPVSRLLEVTFGKRLLNQVTAVSGGRTIAVNNVLKLPEAAALISQELRNQYVLGYRPLRSTRDGKRRRIRVEVNRQLGKLYPVYRNAYTGRAH